jgi:type IV pilus assembly protein PilV
MKTCCGKTIKNEKGFTLLEMLIAVTLIAVGLLATASMQGIALNSNSIANKLSVANLLAQKVVEDLHSRSVSDSIFTSSVSNVAYMLNSSGTPSTNITIPGAGTYSATYTITPNASATGTTRIDVTVRYTSRKYTQTVTNTVTYTTYKMVI